MFLLLHYYVNQTLLENHIVCILQHKSFPFCKVTPMLVTLFILFTMLLKWNENRVRDKHSFVTHQYLVFFMEHIDLEF